MTPERIVEIANRPDVPKFLFGSKELENWTREHRNPHTGEATKDSGYYVVVHRSLDPDQRPDFRVLTRWDWMQSSPRSWDVPATAS